MAGVIITGETGTTVNTDTTVITMTMTATRGVIRDLVVVMTTIQTRPILAAMMDVPEIPEDLLQVILPVTGAATVTAREAKMGYYHREAVQVDREIVLQAITGEVAVTPATGKAGIAAACQTAWFQEHPETEMPDGVWKFADAMAARIRKPAKSQQKAIHAPHQLAG